MENTGKQFRKRNAILTCLRSSVEHPSAEDIYESLQREHSDISRASVYRNLALFKEQGMITSLGTVNGIERFDGRTDSHAHFVCTVCGRVEDVCSAVPAEIAAEAEQSLSCRVNCVQLMLCGICRKCII